MSRLDYKRKKQRELERAERGEVGFVGFVKRHSGIIALLAIIVVVAAVWCTIALNPEYAARLMPNNTETLYLDENTIYEMPYTAQESTVLKACGTNAYLCTRDKLTMLSSSGKTEWELSVALNEPILSVNGGYVLAADRGGKNIYLVNNGKIILQTLSAYNIINASVSADGRFVIIADEPYYKGMVTVKDASDKEIFVYHSGNSYIIDAAIGTDTSKLALAVMNTSSTTEDVSSLSGGIMLFNLYDTEAYKTHFFDGEIITNVFRADGGFMAVMNKKAVAVNAEGEILGEYAYSGKLSKIYKSDRLLVLVLENEGSKKIAVVDNSGKQAFEKSVSFLPGCISADGDRIAYGGGNEISICDSAGKELYLLQTAKKFDTFTLFDNASRGVGLTSLSVDILEIK